MVCLAPVSLHPIGSHPSLFHASQQESISRRVHALTPSLETRSLRMPWPSPRRRSPLPAGFVRRVGTQARTGVRDAASGAAIGRVWRCMSGMAGAGSAADPPGRGASERAALPTPSATALTRSRCIYAGIARIAHVHRFPIFPLPVTLSSASRRLVDQPFGEILVPHRRSRLSHDLVDLSRPHR